MAGRRWHDYEADERGQEVKHSHVSLVFEHILQDSAILDFCCAVGRLDSSCPKHMEVSLCHVHNFGSVYRVMRMGTVEVLVALYSRVRLHLLICVMLPRRDRKSVV